MMSLRLRALAASSALCASLIGLPAFAQAPATTGAAPDPAPDPAIVQAELERGIAKLQRYLAHPAYLQHLQTAIAGIDASLPTLCKKMEHTVRSEPTLLEPVIFADMDSGDETAPIAGVWYERLSFEGCSGMHALSLLMQAQADAPPRAVPLLPGTTIASPDLQLEAVALVRERAAERFPGCDTLQVVQTNFIGFTDESDAESRLKDKSVDIIWQSLPESPDWTEDWMLLGCTGLLPFEVEFLHVDRQGSPVFAVQAVPGQVIALPPADTTAPAESPASAPAGTAPAGEAPVPEEAVTPAEEPAEAQPGAVPEAPPPAVTDTPAESQPQ